MAIALTATFVLLLGALPVAWSGSQAGQDDVDREEQLAAGKMAFRDNCLMCHAEEMTSGLRLTEKQWVAELDKMIGWGAPVPPELKAPLLDYLISAFSDTARAPITPPARIAFRDALALVRPEGPPASGDATRGAALYAANCATCHGPAAAGGDLGTCLVEKPVLLRQAEYSDVVRKGRRRMPGFATALKPEQEADILVWLRTLRFEG
jgi:ubiquinol-cytochrome c reductase cytochrome c subunit